MKEANILKALPRREGLVRVRGAFQKFGTAYCVMEFIEGDSLDRMADRIIERHGRMPSNLIVDLAVATCWALDALHRENLIHRDVKPGNIMVRRSGEPVLIDFGAARNLTRKGQKDIILTRRYAALEQFPEEMSGFNRSFDEGPWSDIYSLSVVLHELIRKSELPDAATRAQAVLASNADPYPPLVGSEFEGHYPNYLLETIDHGCALMPRARIRNAQSFAKRLAADDWERREMTIHAKASRAGGTIFSPKLSPRRKSGRAFAIFLVLAGILGAVLMWIYRTYYFYGEVF